MTDPHLFPGRRYKRHCAALCVVSLLATVPGTLQAATFTVNSTADVVDASPGDGICATAGAVCTLRAATEEANALAGSDTINLPLGTYNLTLGNELILSDLVTIAGGGETGTVIDGTGSDRVIDITANASLSSLTIQNGDIGGGNGGGIRNSAALTLTSVTVRDNTSDNEGGGIHNRNAGASLTLVNVTVDNNTADKGAGIYLRDDGAVLTMTGGAITDNTAADNGGGIFNQKSDVTLSSVTVSGNSSGKDGGGIHNRDSEATLIVTGGSITDNVADGHGGGIFSQKGDTSLSGVTVSGNSSDEDGGGIHNRDAEATLTVIGGSITGNPAVGEGGGIFNQKGDVTLSNVTVSGNSSTKNGGGIHSRDAESSLTVTGGSITGNTSDDRGGGIFNQKGTLIVSGATISGNTAREGGGIHSRDNEATLTVTDSTFSSNRSDDRDGGGIYLRNTTATIRRVTLDGNTAVRDGGAIFSRDTTATLINITVSGNASSRDGGGVFVDGGTVTVTNVTITANSAARSGGGVRRSAGVLQLLNTVVANSTAGGDCSGTITNNGNNLDTDGTCPFGLTAPPLLGPLANNGGPTQTHALQTGSPAIDAGTNAGCPAIDQRGTARPFDGDGDSIATCDIGAYEVGLPMPLLTVVKSALTIEDPISGMTDPKAIPGATERYQVQITNSGPGVADNDSLIITDSIPANTALRILDFDGGNPGPVAFVDGSPASGLTYTFTSLGSITDDLEFSNDGGGTWTYTPVDSGDGNDPAVTDIRISPKGTLAASSGGGDPSFQMIFKVIVL